MNKIFKTEVCKRCEYTFGKSKICNKCKNGSKLSELYNANPNCIHSIRSSSNGGVYCIKCNGWFCF